VRCFWAHNEANGAHVTYLDIDIPMHLLQLERLHGRAEVCPRSALFMIHGTSNRDKHVKLEIGIYLFIFYSWAKRIFFLFRVLFIDTVTKYYHVDMNMRENQIIIMKYRNSWILNKLKFSKMYINRLIAILVTFCWHAIMLKK